MKQSVQQRNAYGHSEHSYQHLLQELYWTIRYGLPVDLLDLIADVQCALPMYHTAVEDA